MASQPRHVPGDEEQDEAGSDDDVIGPAGRRGAQHEQPEDGDRGQHEQPAIEPMPGEGRQAS